MSFVTRLTYFRTAVAISPTDGLGVLEEGWPTSQASAPQAGSVPLVEVKVHGCLDARSARDVNHVLAEAIALHPARLIIDLADCDSIDASGILLLLDAHRRTLRNGGAVALRSPSERLCRNLRLAKVDRVLQVIDGTGCSGAPASSGTRMS